MIAAYTDFLGRAPTASELADKSAALGARTLTRKGLVDGLAASPEWVSAIVNGFYRNTLGRPGEAGGVAFWTARISNKRLSVAQVAAAFYSSSEYFNGIGGGTPATWLDDLHKKLLHRAPTAAEVSSLTAQVASSGRQAVAYDIYQSKGSRLIRVAALYKALLGRSPDAAGADHWAEQILTDGDVALASSLAASDEYYARAHARFP